MSSVFPFSSFVLHWLFGILRRQKLSHLSPIYLVNNWFILLWDKTYLFYYLEYNSKLMYSSRVLCLLGSPHKFFFFFFEHFLTSQDAQKFLFYFLCPSLGMNHFSKGSCSFQSKIWTLGALIAMRMSLFLSQWIDLGMCVCTLTYVNTSISLFPIILINEFLLMSNTSSVWQESTCSF